MKCLQNVDILQEQRQELLRPILARQEPPESSGWLGFIQVTRKCLKFREVCPELR
jgi:hypothetical protein